MLHLIFFLLSALMQTPRSSTIQIGLLLLHFKSMKYVWCFNADLFWKIGSAVDLNKNSGFA